MDVEDLLSPTLSDIELQPISRDFELHRQIPGKEEKPSDQALILILDISDGRNVPLRDDQHMGSGFGMEIIDHDILIVLIHGGRGDLSRDDPAEDAIHGRI